MTHERTHHIEEKAKGKEVKSDGSVSDRWGIHSVYEDPRYRQVKIDLKKLKEYMRNSEKISRGPFLNRLKRFWPCRKSEILPYRESKDDNEEQEFWSYQFFKHGKPHEDIFVTKKNYLLVACNLFERYDPTGALMSIVFDRANREIVKKAKILNNDIQYYGVPAKILRKQLKKHLNCSPSLYTFRYKGKMVAVRDWECHRVQQTDPRS